MRGQGNMMGHKNPQLTKEVKLQQKKKAPENHPKQTQMIKKQTSIRIDKQTHG